MEKKERLVVLQATVVILIAASGFIYKFLGLLPFAVIESMLLAGFILLLLKMKKAFGKDFLRYALYFCLLLLVVSVSIAVLVFSEALGPRIDLFVAVIAALLIINMGFRFLFGKNVLEGKVLLSDNKIAVVELPFDFFAGMQKGMYVVKTDRKIAKGTKVKVKIAQKMFKKVPERIIE